MASFGSKLVRESVFVSELEQEFTSRLGLSCSESSLSPSVASNLGLWLAGIGLHDYEPLFLESGFDDIEFIVSTFLLCVFRRQRLILCYLLEIPSVLLITAALKNDVIKRYVGFNLNTIYT